MPKLDGILETCIHTTDMARAKAFYEGVLELQPIFSDKRLTAYAVAGHNVLLVFQKGATERDRAYSGRRCHSGACRRRHAAAWRSRSARISLRRGSTALPKRALRSKARTPGRAAAAASISAISDGHLLELATPGLWSVY